MGWWCQGAFLPQRFVVATLFLLGLFFQYITRVCFDVAAQVITYHINRKNNPDVICTYNDSSYEESLPGVKTELYWTTYEQADLSSGFFVGYIITQLPGGVLSDWYGPKRVMGAGIFVSGVCVLLTPVCARLTGTIWVLMVNRMVMGLAQGPLFPSISSFIARWAVPSERNIMSAYINVGINLSGMFSILATRFLLNHLESWDFVFYLYGLFAVLFSISWFLVTHDSPADHPCITDDELDKINESLWNEKDDGRLNLPTGALLRSFPVWAVVIATVGHDLKFYLLVTLMPQYMAYVLKVNIMDHTLISCGPHVVMSVFSLTSAVLAQFLVGKGCISKTTQCKIWLAIANMVPSVLFLLASLAGCDRTIAASCFVLAFGFSGFAYSSIWIVNVNLAPNLAGRLMGLMNGAGCFLGLIGPRVVAVISEQQTVEAWRIGFLLNLAVVTLTTVFFLIFGSAELQPWNEPPIPASFLGARRPAHSEDTDGGII